MAHRDRDVVIGSQYDYPEDSSCAFGCAERPAGCEPSLGPGLGCSEECTVLCPEPLDCQNVPGTPCDNAEPGAVICYGS